MKKLRVVLANMPQILMRILRDLVSRQSDMAVVGEVKTLAELPTAVASLQAEAVIFTLSPPSAAQGICTTLRESHPELTLLALALRNDRAVIWPSDASPRPVEMTAASLLGALRDRARKIHRSTRPRTGDQVDG